MGRRRRGGRRSRKQNNKPRQTVETPQAAAPKAPEVAVSAVPVTSWRKVFALTVSAAALVGAGYHYSPDNKVEAPISHTSALELAPPPPQSPQNLSVSIEVDQSIQLPKIEVQSESLEFTKPDRLRMSEEEYQAVCSEVAGKMLGELKKELEIELAAENANTGEVKNMFASKVIRAIMKSHPQMETDWALLMRSVGMDPGEHMKRMNETLHGAGYHLFARPVGNGEMVLNILPIKRAESVKVWDDKVEVEVPVIYVGDGLLDEKVQIDQLGTLSGLHDGGTVVIFEGNLDASIDLLLKGRPELPRFQNIPERSVMLEEQVRLTRHHEVVHALLEKRFPLTKKHYFQHFYRPLPIGIGDGKMVPLHGNYTPSHFNELAAFGAEFSTFGSLATLAHGPYLAPPDTANPLYYLFRKVIPFATLESAPESDVKEAAIQSIIDGGDIYDPVMSLIGTGPYTNEDSREAGAIMYRLGYAHLEAIERGLEAAGAK